MPVSHVANRGTATSKTASQTLVISPTDTIPAGALLVMFLAWDNNNTGTDDLGGISEQHWVSDSAGNVWTTYASGQTRGAGGQNLGVHAAIHVCILETQLTTASTITAKLGTGNSLVAKAISIHEFALSSSAHRIYLADRSSGQSIASDPASLGIGFGQLFLHVLGAEGPDTDAYTWDSDYTQITGAGTTGGSDDSNVHVRGGYRIATLSSDTVDVASTTADRDYWQALIALVEYVPDAFPQTPIIDDFNRANEDPLAGGWYSGSFIFGGTPGLAVSSNVCKTGGSSAAYRGQWWAEEFTAMQEAYVTCTTAASTEDDGFGVGVSGDLDASANGGRVLWQAIPTGNSASEDSISSGYADPNSISHRVRTWADMQAGRKLGMRAVPQSGFGILETWGDFGSGWKWLNAYTSSEPLDAQKISLICRDQTVRVDDFGGGGAFAPQLYRRVRR